MSRRYRPVSANVTVGDRTFLVHGTFFPSTPHTFYLRNGDPGYPGDPVDAEILSVYDEDGFEVLSGDLSIDEEEEIINKLIETGEAQVP